MPSKNISIWFHNTSLALAGLALFAFPLVFTTFTTDPFSIPKQAFLGAFSLLGILLLAIKFVLEGKVQLRRTPYDLPVVIFLAVLLVSSLVSINRFDSLASYIPLLFAGIFFFVVTNVSKDKASALFLTVSFVLGAILLGTITSLSYFKIYILPFAGTQAQTFTTLGTLFDASIYIAAGFLVCLSKIWPVKKIGRDTLSSVFTVASLISLGALIVSAVSVFTLAKPSILPFQIGFQTAFAEISQDAGRLVLGFLFGSGFGTYLTDFTRFKPVVYNQNPQLWSLIFVRSSSFVLELIATTGILGIGAYLFLAFRVLKAGRYLPLLAIFVASFVLPFSFTIIVLFFFLLALAASNLGTDGSKADFFDVEVSLVALREGVLALSAPTGKVSGRVKVLPVLFIAAVLLAGGFLAFYAARFVISDLSFQRSLVAASQNNGSETYTLQQNAIRQFPYKDVYFRVFSQTNLALADSLAASVPQGSSPSAQIQQGIVTLTQQSINAGRQATALSPLTSLNWQQLSGIYRALFGFGQNAEAFAVQAMQQAIILDPNNPQLYVSLGGIYYQLARYDDAQRQFQVAISLKPDYANGYYNLAQALKQKGSLKEALEQLETARSLVLNDKENLKIVEKEIEELKKQIAVEDTDGSEQTSSSVQEPLAVPTPQVSLPPQNPQVEIPPPDTSTSSAN